MIRSDGTASSLFLLDVAPTPAKLGRDIFAEMLAEIWAVDPTLVIGDEPATVQVGELGAQEDPWLAFARLRRHLPGVLCALRAIGEQPLKTLRRHRDSAPLHHVRRVDRQTALSISRSPALALFVHQSDQPIESPYGTRLDVPAVEESLDSAANRALLALLTGLLLRVRTVRQRLQDIVASAVISDTRTSLVPRWPARRHFLDSAETDLTCIVKRRPFASVRRSEVTAAGLNAVSAHPLYGRAWSQGWRALRHGLESDPTTERLWISPSWEIFERWCFVALGRQLQTSEMGRWRLDSARRRWIGDFSEGRAELRLQPTFQSRDGEWAGRWSISKQRIPDLVLTLFRAEDVRFIVMDAKYRTSRENVLDAMQSAHIYQDSLRVGQRRPEASLLLTPARTGATWLESPEFHAQHRVGVHVLSPDGVSRLPASVLAGLQSLG